MPPLSFSCLSYLVGRNCPEKLHAASLLHHKFELKHPTIDGWPFDTYQTRQKFISPLHFLALLQYHAQSAKAATRITGSEAMGRKRLLIRLSMSEDPHGLMPIVDHSLQPIFNSHATARVASKQG